MALDDFSTNLRLLCSYGNSVSEVCRRMRMNRQQFHRYLTGATKPSLQTIRRICDYFSIEDHEIFLACETFQDLIRLRPPRLDGNRNPMHDYFDKLFATPEQALKYPDKYIGYYYYYSQPSRSSKRIYRSIVQIYRNGGYLFSKQLERYPDSEISLPDVLKHDGIVYTVSDRLIMTERESSAGASLWHSIFYTSDNNRITFLAGLSVGVTPESAHTVVAYRSLLEYLGEDIDLKSALRHCGSYDYEALEVGPYIKACVSNDLAEHDDTFSPKFS